MNRGITGQNFIDEQYLREFSTVDLNVDVNFSMMITLAQEKYLKPILSTALFEELIEQVSANTLTAFNEILLDEYVKPALVLFTLYDSVKKFHYKWTNKGILKTSSETEKAITKEELNDLKDSELMDDAQLFGSRLKNFLIANISNYPKYVNQDGSFDDILPQQEIFSAGLYIGGGVRKRYGFQGSRFDN